MGESMNKIFSKITLLSLLLTSGIMATEFRSPWLSERGPIRYIFETDEDERSSLDVYALAHRRESHKAFLKHGTNTSALTALFFNKEDFNIAESFPNAQINQNAKYYNPYLGLQTLKPRATYYEWGMNLGARLEYPVWKDKGRLGVRVNIPFRSVEIEREDVNTQVDNPEDEYILSTYTKVGNYVPPIGTGYQEPVDVIAKAYNIDFIASLFQDNARTSALQFADGSARVFGVEIAKDFNTNDKSFKTDIKPIAGVIAKTATGNPQTPNFNEWGYTAGVKTARENGSDIAETNGAGGYGVRAGDGANVYAVENRHNWAFDAGDDVKIATASLQSRAIRHNANTFPAAVQATEIMKAPNVAFFNTTNGDHNYSTFMDANSYPTNMPQYLKDSWLVLGYDNGQLVPGATVIKDSIDNALQQYTQDPYEWLLDRGYVFETQRRTGVGDIDIDFFYEHMFSESFLLEPFIGFRLPTGTGDDFSGNAYKAHLGNGEHFEIKLGLMAVNQLADWVNIKLDSFVSFVMQATEERCAVFEGSTIKNIGPKVNADVDWTYFVARLDATMFHPKTQDISATIGYEFYLKGKDNIHFKDSQATPLYGPHFTDPNDLLLANLSNDLAEANTDSISHKLRLEARVQINDYFELIGGASFTFAGQNIPRETDAHAGFNVKF
jgi:hypothetical protein